METSRAALYLASRDTAGLFMVPETLPADRCRISEQPQPLRRNRIFVLERRVFPARRRQRERQRLIADPTNPPRGRLCPTAD